ncbi:hypothetical protein AS149_14910 [Burkholderia cenocepacia]|nr:hypothetical protein AS149_14910 [Burkholderia cenocepacia]
MHTHRYSSVSFHHDGDFTGSVLVTASSLASDDASPSSSEPSFSRATAVATFATLEQLAACASERQEYVDLVGPGSDRHSRFEVCDNTHVCVLAGPSLTVTVCFRRDELLEFLRLAVAHRARPVES